ncbi:bifunctional DNA-formamidopyrimidine glycosylase/DNA-(apurinic or apyrimidinic site) lyase [Acinetobacter soli]|jgi:formamidopyrimidine-DNA glycosylase|uniref:bifunctional DNA-formamidopyrimidine glycosylase/DNA-(apurinic or apyrimidinic site) lyase n=1 Tax=Acinetobacter soli TaxID=487316 RepID=UPI00124FC538|nr:MULTISPECIES: bifunctional DNA-formamidopyrimidine glycosylase/DNA-(apurinic or apyrimidinic site) lyase [Acinetobacter]MBV6551186.1 bifunctional DNA-formamidopyrimidine glycosylase/DNA-(apurinic or apyrimidinic site) lyase [Acinetobacter soli]MDQ9832127.1 bifunctional DNA-formamidopyrimidine glycosylase/DNA-(apurinic or apyrimidinic site) lyase [Acinetobacter soli]WON79313.1 bifunctional DNA-formamidopyrimidine glycosylase/DNA-(apurinic or apyrimidinic site) lyase [Acinetobacter sp. UGAL515B
MPELPEVETTKTSLLPLLHHRVQSVTVRDSRLRWAIPDDISRLVGQELRALKRRSKYILAEFETDQMLWHLGMSGSFRLCTAQDELRKHDHLILTFDDGTELRYHDPRRFGCILWLNDEHQKKLIDTLGPEPLSDAFNADYLYEKLRTKQVGIKIAIMDNHVVVGVGNIYATESLFNLGIHPAQPANTLSSEQIAGLVVEIKRILSHAIQLGGSTLRDYTNAMGENGYFQQTLLAYGRAGEMCVNCETTLENMKLGQRASVFCPQCQPLKLNSTVPKRRKRG